MNSETKIKELVDLVKDLWEVRKYGIPEMELQSRVSKALSYDDSEIYFTGLRPVDSNGISLTPDIKDGKVSYTKYYEPRT
jgi:hypothetical protein